MSGKLNINGIEMDPDSPEDTLIAMAKATGGVPSFVLHAIRPMLSEEAMARVMAASDAAEQAGPIDRASALDRAFGSDGL